MSLGSSNIISSNSCWCSNMHSINSQSLLKSSTILHNNTILSGKTQNRLNMSWQIDMTRKTFKLPDLNQYFPLYVSLALLLTSLCSYHSVDYYSLNKEITIILFYSKSWPKDGSDSLSPTIHWEERNWVDPSLTIMRGQIIVSWSYHHFGPEEPQKSNSTPMIVFWWNELTKISLRDP